MRVTLSKTMATAVAALGLALSGLSARAQETLLIGWTNSWAYNDTTTPTANLHGTGWELPGYDTNSAPGWKSGPALFGNDSAGLYDGPGRPFSGGINGFLTPLNRGVATAADRVTFYFRKKFNYNGVANPILETKWVHDDGIVVYLNGTEILRSKMTVAAPTPVAWDTFGANHDAAGFPPVVVEGFEYTADLSSASLVQGENVVAVELHQSSTTSSDVAFALEMKAVIPFAPSITNAAQPADRVVVQNRSTTLQVFAIGSRPLTYQWFFEPAAGGGYQPIPDATNSTYTIASMAQSNEGNYYVTVSNPVGTVDSRVARVTYSQDSTPPTLVRAHGAATNDTLVVEFSEPMDPQNVLESFSYGVIDGAMNLENPLGVTLNPGGRSVTLRMVNPMVEGALYTVRIDAGTITDVAGNFIATSEVQFRTWVSGTCAGLLYEVYDTASTPGNAVNLLTSHPSFPNSPRETFRMEEFNTDSVWSGVPDTDNRRQQIGGRVRGLFIPPYSGAWRFFLNTDDSSELWLNPNGPSPSGRTRVAIESGCCNAFSEPGTPRTSEPQNLVGGQAYYIEALYKEGIGGDYCRIAARADGDPTPAATLTSMPASMFGVPAAPANIIGNFTIAQQPASQTVVPNSSATFTVATSTDALLCYQWRRDGADIPGANNSQYTLVATPADNGARFSVRISALGGGTITSSDAILTVEADTIRPTALSATTDKAGINVTVTFSEPMGAASAQNVANYTINGVNPASATLTSPTVVTLVAASALPDCVRGVLVINNVADSSGNLVNPNPTTLTFSKPLVLVGNNDTQIWRYEDTGADLGTAWRESVFDDSTWASGPGPLALEDPATMPAGWPIRTSLTNYTSARITMYFRTRFNLGTDPRAISRLQLTQVIDDGAVYWINGKELGRLRVDGVPTYSTLAGGSTEPHPIEGPVDVPTSDLKYGENVLAVEVHQSGTASSDIVFGAELTATVSACVPPLTVTRSGGQIILTWPDPSFRLERAPTVTGPWTSQAGASGVSLPASPNNAFFRLVSP